jgi:hypothetical protein
MRKFVIVPILATVLFLPGTSSAAMKYKNCTELRKKFPAGVAQTAKSAGTSGAKVSKSIYTLHKGLDRDKDGIACEK